MTLATGALIIGASFLDVQVTISMAVVLLIFAVGLIVGILLSSSHGRSGFR